jgi:hypothetical protein
MKSYFCFVSLLFFCNLINSIDSIDTIDSNSLVNNTNLINYSNLKCDTCKLSIDVIENYLQKNHTVIELEQVLDNLCNKTPVSHDCSELVNEYLPSIINLIEQEVSPDEICNQIHLCNSTKRYN